MTDAYIASIANSAESDKMPHYVKFCHGSIFTVCQRMPKKQFTGVQYKNDSNRNPILELNKCIMSQYQNVLPLSNLFQTASLWCKKCCSQIHPNIAAQPVKEIDLFISYQPC